MCSRVIIVIPNTGKLLTDFLQMTCVRNYEVKRRKMGRWGRGWGLEEVTGNRGEGGVGREEVELRAELNAPVEYIRRPV